MTGNIKKALLFVALTFFFSWLLAALFYVVGGRLNTAAAYVVLIVYMFIPMTMAIVVQKLIYKEPLREPLGISFKLNWWFISYLSHDFFCYNDL